MSVFRRKPGATITSGIRVLHLPFNIASQMSTLLRAQKEMGDNPVGLVARLLLIQDGRGIRSISSRACGAGIDALPGRFLLVLRWTCAVYKAMRRAHVVHWHSTWSVLPFGLDVRIAGWIARPRVVSAVGSDVRIPDIGGADNPYYAKAHALGQLPGETRSGSMKAQRLFSRCGFSLLLCDHEISQHIQLPFRSTFRSAAPILVGDFIPAYPAPGHVRRLLIHAPSHRGGKGTEAVLACIAKLTLRHQFDFRLIEGLRHEEAVLRYRQADIIIDQFVWGTYGLLALEAMALGKPVACYLKPSVAGQLPPGCPIINASQDSLFNTLSELLDNDHRLNEIGRLSRQYVEKHHDAGVIARRLHADYRKLILDHLRRR